MTLHFSCGVTGLHMYDKSVFVKETYSNTAYAY